MSARQGGAAVVLVTATNEEQALAIARAVVDERLAACANLIGPIRSIYRWQGKLHDDREHLLIIKSRASMVPKLERRVKELHSYEVPEVIALPIAAGSKPYLEWLLEATEAPRGRGSKARRRPS